MLAQERAPVPPVALGCRRDPGGSEHVADQGGRDVDPELAQLADDPHVVPTGVLARQSQDQLAHMTVDRRAAGTPVRVRPVVGDQAPMPAQQRLRSHRERPPRATRQHPAERGQEQPVARREPRSPDLPAQDRQLVAQHQDLKLLGALAAPEQHHQLEQTTGKDVDQRQDQEPPPEDKNARRYLGRNSARRCRPAAEPSLCTPRPNSQHRPG
jgi:hypothetical protein